ncbi:Adenylyl cyclase-associated protein [Beauveria bassiana]|nr:Adenylyl cyclase-associated protein [Beauveria bassiana]
MSSLLIKRVVMTFGIFSPLYRLEAATSRLEDIATSTELPKEVGALAAPAPSSSALNNPDASAIGAPRSASQPVPEELPESIEDFDAFVDSTVADYVQRSNEIGGLVAKQAAEVLAGFKAQRKFLLITTKSIKPDLQGADMALYQDLLKPINDSLMAVTELKEANRSDPMYTQLSAVADGIMVLAWVTVSHKPYTHVEEFLGSAQFFGNRVIKEYKDKGVGHGLAPVGRLLGEGAAGLGAAELEATGGGRLVGRSVLAVHLEVGVLDEHLDVGVGRALELLDETLAVSLEGLDGKLVLANNALEVGDGAVNFGLDGRGNLKAENLGFRKVGADRSLGKIEFVVEDEVADVVVEAVGRSTVHHGVLTHEARGAVIVDDELEGFVVPAIGTVTVPVGMGTLLEGDGRGVIETDDKGGCLNGLETSLVLGAGVEENGARIGPDVAVLRGQSTDRWNILSSLVDAAELLLKLGGVKLLAVDLVEDLEELVLADDDNVLVGVGRVLLRVVGRLSGDTGAVEHPLVAVHADGQLLHVLGLEGTLVDHLLELEDGGADGGSALGGVAALAVVAVGVKVADIGDNGVAVAEVGGIVPPLIDPVLGLGVGGLGLELLLKLAADTAGLDKFLDSSLGVFQLGGREQRSQALEVSSGGLLEGRDGKAGQRVLKSQGGALGGVLDVACE